MLRSRHSLLPLPDEYYSKRCNQVQKLPTNYTNKGAKSVMCVANEDIVFLEQWIFIIKTLSRDLRYSSCLLWRFYVDRPSSFLFGSVSVYVLFLFLVACGGTHHDLSALWFIDVLILLLIVQLILLILVSFLSLVSAPFSYNVSVVNVDLFSFVTLSVKF